MVDEKINKKAFAESLDLSEELDMLSSIFLKKKTPKTYKEDSYSPLPKRSVKFYNPIHGEYHNVGEYGVPHIKNPSRKHKGVDLAASRGTPVYAAAEGRVARISYDERSSGNMVQIDHPNGMRTNYMHLDSVNCREGQIVGPNTVIGKVGNTGNAKDTYPHLHFEVVSSYSGGGALNPSEVGISISPVDAGFMRDVSKGKVKF
jgi:murein DD-endopeptidase MepM/ murein hydrolase activator NlpD